MIEIAIFFGMGFLTAALIGIAIIPLIHNRAVRLTTESLMGEKKNLPPDSHV